MRLLCRYSVLLVSLSLAMGSSAQEPSPADVRAAMQCRETVNSRTSPEMQARIDEAVETVMRERALPSTSVAIVRNGQVAYVCAYGHARLDPKQLAASWMPYAIGSISKQFTAVAVLMLAEEGKLSLDDKVARWFPKLTRANDISIRQLLSMTSGYQDFWPHDYLPPEMAKPTTPGHIMQKWAGKALDFEPGTKYQYSNTNYTIAGEIVEKVSGVPFFTFLDQRIFKPLGLKSAMSLERQQQAEDYPIGYERFALGPPRPATKEGAGWLKAIGELAMTAGDLARWNIAFMERKLLKPESYRELQRTQVLANGAPANYALGLAVGMSQGRHFVSHSGEVMGFVADNVVYPEEKVAIVVLTNQMTSGASDITGRITAILFPPDAATRNSEAKVRQAFIELQQGRIDRSRFTASANFYFNETALRDFAQTLGPLGEPKEMNPGPRRMRGGFILQSYRPVVGGKRLRLSVFETPDGKFEQFLVEPD